MVSTVLLTLVSTTYAAMTVVPASEPQLNVMVDARTRDRPGLTVSFGFGNAYGFPGMQVRYDRPLRPWLHLAPFAAVGIAPDYHWLWVVGAAGVSAGLGWRHRLAADLAVTPVASQQLNLHGTIIDLRTTYGPNIGLGYEHVSDNGWMQRAVLGYGWGIWGKGEGPFPSDVTLTLGVGTRLW